VAPPELAGNAPVADVLHPVQIDFRESLRNEADLPVFGRLDGRSGQGLHLHEPLAGKHRLNDGAAAVAVADGVGMVLCLQEGVFRFQVPHDFFTALVTVQTPVARPGLFAHLSLLVDDDDLGQLVTPAHFKVVGVVGRGDLHRAAAEGGVDILVGNNRHLAANQGKEQGFSDQVFISLILRVHRHGDVTEHGFRPGGGHHHAAAAVFKRVF